MAAPTNTTAGTAIDLGALPVTGVTQDVHDAGTTYEVFYKFTAPAGAAVVGLWGRGDFTPIYNVQTRVYDDLALTNLIVNNFGFASGNKRVQFPVTPSTVYYLRFTPNAGNPTPAILTIDAEVAPNSDVVEGDILVPDDTADFPLSVLSPSVDFEVRKFINPFPAGEAGDILPDGTILVDNIANNDLKLYDIDFNLLATVAFALNGSIGGQIRANRTTNKFWAVDNNDPGNVRKISAAGAIEASIVLTAGDDYIAIAANNTDTILYLSTGGTNSPIKQWDIGTGAFISDLVVGVAGYGSTLDILVLEDDSILVCYTDQSPADVNVRRYSAAGALLNTYAFGSDFAFPFGISPRLAYAVDSPDSFWLWNQSRASSTGTSVFINVRVSDGVVIDSVIHQNYETGIYQGTSIAIPLAEFGPSFSCPFLIAQGIALTPGTLTVAKLTDPYDPLAEFIIDVEDGLSPTPITLKDSESQEYTGVVPGTYSVIEQGDIDWFPIYFVSNDVNNDNLNIVIGEGENVTVIILNQKRTEGAGIFTVPSGQNGNESSGGSGLPDKRNDDMPLQDGTLTQVKIPNPTYTTGFVADK